MPRPKDELAAALAQGEAWMDAVNPDEVPDDAIDDRKDLRQIGTALIAIEAGEQALVSAVANARANNRSWTDIATILGVSRQAARQRFAGRIAEHDRDVSPRPASSMSEAGRLDVQTYLAQLEAVPGGSMLAQRIRECLDVPVQGEPGQLDALAEEAQQAHKPS